MKFCEKCGQELSSSVCGFCGQVSKPQVSKEELNEPTSQKPSDERKRFRWLRSDRPKRYLAEMALLSLAALVGVFVIVPGLQGQPQMEAEIDVEDRGSSNSQEETDEIPRDSEEMQEPTDEEPNPQVQNEENQIPPEEPQVPIEEEVFQPFDESIYEWIETWNFEQDPPFLEDGPSCLREACVSETLRVTFEPIENFGLKDLEGSIELRTDKDTRISDPYFSIKAGEGRTELYRQFLVQGLSDLRNYDGDYYFNFIFSGMYELISFESDGREFNLQLDEGSCYRTSEIWWLECGVYAFEMGFELPAQAENGPHGYPLGYYSIPSIRSCSEMETIGRNINGWAATFQAARNAGATQAFVSTQHYAKLFELDTNLDGVVCSSQAPE